MAICFDKVTANVHTPTRRRDFIHRSSRLTLRSSWLTSSHLFGVPGAPISVVARALPQFVARIESHPSLTTSPPVCRWRSDESSLKSAASPSLFWERREDHLRVCQTK